MPSSSRAKPPRTASPGLVHADPLDGGRGGGAAARPGAGVETPRACGPSAASRTCCRPAGSALPPTPRRPRRSAAGSRSSPRRPGRSSSTSWIPAVRRRPGRRGTRAAGGRRDAGGGSCWPVDCSCPAAAGSCPAGRVGVALRAAGRPWIPSTSSPTSRPRHATARWSTGPVRARRSRRCAGSSCSWITGARAAVGAAQWRPGRARPAGHGDRPAGRPGGRGAADRDGVRRRAARDRRRPRRQPGGIPTDLFDQWTARPDAERWTALVAAWLETPRMPSVVGQRDPAGKVWNALAPELAGVHQVESRRMALDVLAACRRARCSPRGPASPRWCGACLAAPPGGRGPVPTRSRGPSTRAAVLGLVALGGLTSYGRALLDDDRAAAERTLGALLPEPVDHVLLQADLTAVAPGPLESHLARRLQVVADVESRAGPPSTGSPPGPCAARSTSAGRPPRCTSCSARRRAHRFPSRWPASSTTPPGPTAPSGSGRPRRSCAPTTRPRSPSCSTTPRRRAGSAPDRADRAGLLHPGRPAAPRLRELGAAPVAGGRGRDRARRAARPLQARTPREHRGRAVRSAHDAAHTAHAVTAVRAGDRAEASRPATPAATLSPSGSMAALREGRGQGATVLIGYVDNQGTTTRRLVDPVRVGRLAHRARPPQRRPPHLRRPPHHHGAPGRRCGRRIGRLASWIVGAASRILSTVETWTSWSTPGLGRPPQRRPVGRRGAGGVPRRPEWLRSRATDRDCMLLRKFQRELRPVFEAGEADRVADVVSGLNAR